MKSSLLNLPSLRAVEEVIASKFESEAALLHDIPAYLFGLGGKRVRPALALLTAQTLGQTNPSQALLDVSAGIELIHMATLLHDDIIDKSPLRRHKTSPYLRFGIGNTLLAGDFLLVRAFSLCAKLDKFIIDATEQACVELTEGEILEVPLHEQKHNLDSALTISRKKTAALFRLAAESGAHLSTPNTETVEHFAQFGESLGIAFQILDDVLDVISTESSMGKLAGMDLRERKPSVVNVIWLESGSELAKELLLAPRGELEEDKFVAAALNELKTKSNCIPQAKSLAHKYTESALESLSQAQASQGELKAEPLKVLKALVNYTLERLG